MDHRILKIKSELEKIRQSAGKKSFSEALKKEVLSLWDEGYPLPALCTKLRLHKPQVYSWKYRLKSSANISKTDDYEIKEIPVIKNSFEAKNIFNNSKKTKFYFRFLSLKITWE